MKINCLIAAASMFVTGNAVAQYVHFSQLPNSFTNSPQTFRIFFARANCEFRDILVMGDSQETSPGGQGDVYIPRLNYNGNLLWGNSSKSPWIGYNSSSGGGTPWAEWLVQTANAGGGVGPTIQSPATILPNFGGCITSTNTGPNIRGIQWYGQLFGLNRYAENCNPNNTFLPGPHTYFFSTLDFETIVINNINNSNIVFQAKPNNIPANDYFRPITTTRISTVNTRVSGGYTRFTETGFSYGGNNRMQIEVSGDDVHKTVEILCSRFITNGTAGGISFTDASAGGYTATSILTNHNLSGPLLQTLNPDCIMLTYGANDSGQGKTPAQFENDIRVLINWIQQYLPNSLFILAADPFRTQSNQQKYDNMDLYSSAMYNIAQNTNKVLFLNSRKLTDALGWNAIHYSDFLSDGVHYNGNGAIRKAEVELQEIYETFMNPPCIADYNEDCGVTIDDLLLFLEAFELGLGQTDVDRDGGITIDDLLLYLESFEMGC